MIRTSLMAFLKDEDASAALEYLALVGILGIAWIAVTTEYKAQVVAMYAKIAQDLSRIHFGS